MYVYCKENPKHKQRQGHFHTSAGESEAMNGWQFPISQEYCFFAPSLPKINLHVSESSVSGRATNLVERYDPVVGINSVLF